MNSKSKVIIAVSAFAMVVLAIVITIVTVLAATQAKANGGINITYKAGAHVNTSINCAMGTVNPESGDWLSYDSVGSVGFNGTEIGSDSTKNLTVSNIEMTDSNPCVYLYFTFAHNDAANQEKTLRGDLVISNANIGENFKVYAQTFCGPMQSWEEVTDLNSFTSGHYEEYGVADNCVTMFKIEATEFA